jgi:Holliday junction resolvase RusA-like endonuclease
MKTYTILGNPVAQGRVRSAIVHGKDKSYISHYDPKKSKVAKEDIKAQVIAQGPVYYESGPLYLDVTFEISRPKSHYRPNGQLKGNAPIHCDKKPDCSNYLKGLEDALNGILWRDDSQLSIVSMRKRYASKEPKTTLTIGTLGGDE